MSTNQKETQLQMVKVQDSEYFLTQNQSTSSQQSDQTEQEPEPHFLDKEEINAATPKMVEKETNIQNSGQDLFYEKESSFERATDKTNQQVKSTKKIDSLDTERTEETAAEAVYTKTEMQDSGQDLLCQKENSCKKVICQSDQSVSSPKHPSFLNPEKTKEIFGKETLMEDPCQDLPWQKENCEKLICETSEQVALTEKLDFIDTDRIKEVTLKAVNSDTNKQDSDQDLFYQKEIPCERVICETGQFIHLPKQPDFPNTEGRTETALESVEIESQVQDSGQDLFHQEEISSERVICETGQSIHSPKQPDFLNTEGTTETALNTVEIERQVQDSGQDLFHQEEISSERIICETGQFIHSPKQPDFLNTEETTETALNTVEIESQVQDSVQDLFHQEEISSERVICETGQFIHSPKQPDFLNTEETIETALNTVEIESQLQDSGQDLFHQEEISSERVICETGQFIHSLKQPYFLNTEETTETALNTVEIESQLQDSGQDLFHQEEISSERVISETGQFIHSPKQPDFLNTEETTETALNTVEIESQVQDSGQDLFHQEEISSERVICETGQFIHSPKQPDFLNKEGTTETASKTVEIESQEKDSGRDLFHQEEISSERVICETSQSIHSPKQPDFLNIEGTTETALKTVEIESQVQDSGQDLFHQEGISSERVICETGQSMHAKQPDFFNTEGTTETALKAVEKESLVQDSGQDYFHQEEISSERFICETGQSIPSFKQNDLLNTEIKEIALETVEKESLVQDSGQDLFHQKESSCKLVICKTNQQVPLNKKLDSCSTERTKDTDSEAFYAEKKVQYSEQDLDHKDLLCEKESFCERTICVNEKQDPGSGLFCPKERTIFETDSQLALTVQQESFSEIVISETNQQVESTKKLDSLDTKTQIQYPKGATNTQIEDSGQDLWQQESSCKKIIANIDQQQTDFRDKERTKDTNEKETEIPNSEQDLFHQKESCCDIEGTKETALETVETETEIHDSGQYPFYKKESVYEKGICKTNRFEPIPKQSKYLDTQINIEIALETVQKANKVQDLEQDISNQKERPCERVICKTVQSIPPPKQLDYIDSERTENTALEESKRETTMQDLEDLLPQEESSCKTNQQVESSKIIDFLETQISKETAQMQDSVQDIANSEASNSNQESFQFNIKQQKGFSSNNESDSEFLSTSGTEMEQSAKISSFVSETKDLIKTVSVKTEISSKSTHFTEIETHIKEEDDTTDIEPDEEIDSNIFGQQLNKQEIDGHIKEEDDATDIEPDEEIDPNLPLVNRQDFDFSDQYGNELGLMKMSVADFARLHFPDASTTFTISNIKQLPDEKPYIESAITSRNMFGNIFSPPRKKETKTNKSPLQLENNIPADFQRECFVMLERIKHKTFNDYCDKEQSLLRVIREELQEDRYGVAPKRRKRGRPRKISKVRGNHRNWNKIKIKNIVGPTVVGKDIKHANMESSQFKKIGRARRKEQKSETIDIKKKSDTTKNKIRNQPEQPEKSTLHFTTADRKAKNDRKNNNGYNNENSEEKDNSDSPIVRKPGRPKKKDKVNKFPKIHLTTAKNKMENMSRSKKGKQTLIINLKNDRVTIEKDSSNSNLTVAKNKIEILSRSKKEKLELKNDKVTNEKDSSNSSINKRTGNFRKIDVFKNKNKIRSQLEKKPMKDRKNDTEKDNLTSEKHNSDSSKIKKGGRPRKVVEQGELKKSNRNPKKRKLIKSPSRIHNRKMVATSSDDDERTVSAFSDIEDTIYISDTEEPPPKKNNLSPKNQPKTSKQQPSTSHEPKRSVIGKDQQNALNQQSKISATLAIRQQTNSNQLLSTLQDQGKKENIEYIMAVIANPRFCYPCNALVAPGTRLFWFPEKSPLRRMKWLQYCEWFPHFVNPFNLETDMYEHFMRNVKLCPKHFSSKQLIRDSAPTILTPNAVPDIAIRERNEGKTISEDPSNDVILMPSCLASEEDNNSSSQQPSLKLKRFAEIGTSEKCQPFNKTVGESSKSVLTKSSPQISQKASLQHSNLQSNRFDNFKYKQFSQKASLGPPQLISRTAQGLVNTSPQISKSVLTKNSPQRNCISQHPRLKLKPFAKEAQHQSQSLLEDKGMSQHPKLKVKPFVKKAQHQLVNRNQPPVKNKPDNLRTFEVLKKSSPQISNRNKQPIENSSELLQQALEQPFLIMSGPQHALLETGCNSQLFAEEDLVLEEDITDVELSSQPPEIPNKKDAVTPNVGQKCTSFAKKDLLVDKKLENAKLSARYTDLLNKEYAETIKRGKSQAEVISDYIKTRPPGFPYFTKLNTFCCVCEKEFSACIKLSDIPTKSEPPIGLKVWLRTVVAQKSLKNFILENHHLLYICPSHKADYRECFRVVLNRVVHDHDYFNFKSFQLGLPTKQVQYIPETKRIKSNVSELKKGKYALVPTEKKVITICDSDDEGKFTKIIRVHEISDNNVSENTSNDKDSEELTENVNKCLEMDIVEPAFTDSEEPLSNISIENADVEEETLLECQELLSETLGENNYQIEEIFIPEYVPIESTSNFSQTKNISRNNSVHETQLTSNTNTSKIINPTKSRTAEKLVNKKNISAENSYLVSTNTSKNVSAAKSCIDLTASNVSTTMADNNKPLVKNNIKNLAPTLSKSSYLTKLNKNNSPKQAQFASTSTANTSKNVSAANSCIDLTASNVSTTMADNNKPLLKNNIKNLAPIISKSSYITELKKNNSAKQAQFTSTSTANVHLDLDTPQVSAANSSYTNCNKKNISKNISVGTSSTSPANMYVDLTSSDVSEKGRIASKNDTFIIKPKDISSFSPSTSNVIKKTYSKQTKVISESNVPQVKHNLKIKPTSSNFNKPQLNSSHNPSSGKGAQTPIFSIRSVKNHQDSKEETIFLGHTLVKMSHLDKNDPALLVKRLLEKNIIADKIGVDKQHFVIDFLKDGRFVVKLDDIGHKQYLKNIAKQKKENPNTTGENITIIDSDEEVDSTKAKPSDKKVSVGTKKHSADEAKKIASDSLKKYFQKCDCIEIVEENKTIPNTSVSSNSINKSKNSLSCASKYLNKYTPKYKVAAKTQSSAIQDHVNKTRINNSTNENIDLTDVNKTPINDSTNENIDLTDYMMEVLSSDEETGKCVLDGCEGGDLTFRVPDDALVLRTWQLCLNTPPLTPHDRVCDKHFLPSDIIVDSNGEKVLKLHAVPDKFRSTYACSMKKGCCVPDCVNQNNDVDIMLPIPFWRSDLQRDWLRAIKNLGINEKFYQYRLCDQHFEPEVLENRVVIKAPTRNLPEVLAGLKDNGKHLEKKYDLPKTPETIKTVNLTKNNLFNTCAFKGCTETNQSGAFKMYFKIPSDDHEKTFKWLNFMERDDILNKSRIEMKTFAQQSVGVCISHLGVEMIQSDPNSDPGTSSSNQGDTPQAHFKVVHDKCAVLLADKPDIVKVDVTSNKRKLMACRGGLKHKIQKLDNVGTSDGSAVVIE